MRSTQVEHHRFRFQIVRLSATAKLTHARYGSISHPADAERCEKTIIVVRIALYNRTISISAAPGLRNPENSTDHAALRRSWMPNRAIGFAHCNTDSQLRPSERTVFKASAGASAELSHLTRFVTLERWRRFACIGGMRTGSSPAGFVFREANRPSGRHRMAGKSQRSHRASPQDDWSVQLG